MRKYIYTLLLLVLSLPLFAQEECDYMIPDFDEIEREIVDVKSHYYYPPLMKRYLDGDTAMTAIELQYLYYGYSFQEDYNPYRDVKYNTRFDSELYSKEEHTDEECKTIIDNAKTILADFPFELRQMKLLEYAYVQLDDLQNARFWSTRLRQILSVIISSGDGVSPETAWYVISSIHPYDVVYCFGLTPDGYAFVEPMYDFIEVENIPTEGYYFNVSRLLKEYHRKQ